MTVLEGSRVRLRAFAPDEIDEAMGRMQTIPPSERDEELRRERRPRLERSGTRNDWEVLFAIDVDGRVVGDVQGRCQRYAMPPGVWELGIELWDVADRGQGFGREAVAMLASHLFERENAIRVQATTDLENASMRRVFEVLGFGFEGVLRGYMPQAEGPARDFAMYAMTKTDWQACRLEWMTQGFNEGARGRNRS